MSQSGFSSANGLPFEAIAELRALLAGKPRQP